MHDRRIDGETFVFGNASTLFMTAMTWFDHETESIWSQPWGRAIQGELKGVTLYLLPSQVTTWGAWRQEHPETLAMTNDVGRFSQFRQQFSADFVIGLLFGEEAKAYYYRDVAAEVVVNDWMGEFPVLVWAADQNFHAYLRQVGDRILTFRQHEEGRLIDLETSSFWDVALGLAVEGPLKGEALRPIPTSSAYDWAWRDFYPQSEFYDPAK